MIYWEKLRENFLFWPKTQWTALTDIATSPFLVAKNLTTCNIHGKHLFKCNFNMIKAYFPTEEIFLFVLFLICQLNLFVWKKKDR